MFNNIPRKWLLIGAAVVVFVIVPLLILLSVSLAENEKIVNPEEALRSSAEPEILETVYGNTNTNTASSGSVIHEIARDGDWVATVVISTAAADYGNSSIIIYHKVDGEYEIAYGGSGPTEEDLLEVDVPDNIISRVLDPNVPDYLSAIDDSAENPIRKYPIMNYLPFNRAGVEITYAFHDDLDVSTFYLTVDTYPETQSAAVDQIFGMGFDPGNYEIKFTNYSNPFKRSSR
jgi:hypothetical protein